MNSASLPLLTVREVAERLRLSAAAVYEMIRTGKLLSIRIGPRRGAIRVRVEDVDACIESAEQVVSAPRTTSRAPKVKLKHIRLS
jgi:excisionase family DNA binding protein